MKIIGSYMVLPGKLAYLCYLCEVFIRTDLGNSPDSDQTAPKSKEQSDQGLHCLSDICKLKTSRFDEILSQKSPA